MNLCSGHGISSGEYQTETYETDKILYQQAEGYCFGQLFFLDSLYSNMGCYSCRAIYSREYYTFFRIFVLQFLSGLVSFLCHYDLGTLKQCNGVKSKNESVLDLLISQRDEKPSFMKNHISENNSFF